MMKFILKFKMQKVSNFSTNQILNKRVSHLFNLIIQKWWNKILILHKHIWNKLHDAILSLNNRLFKDFFCSNSIWRQQRKYIFLKIYIIFILGKKTRLRNHIYLISIILYFWVRFPQQQKNAMMKYLLQLAVL